MSIKKFFREYSFWAVTAAICAGGIVLIFLLVVLLYIFCPLTNWPDWIDFIAEWCLPLLFGLFLAASVLHGTEIERGLEDARLRTEAQKKLDSINKRMALLEKESELNQKRIEIYKELADLKQQEIERKTKGKGE